MKPLRVAVIGVGHLGKEHARIYAAIPGVTLVGVADIDGARAREVAERCKTRAFASHAELLGQVDAVSVAVPTRGHRAVAGEFLDRGIHALVEKPLAHTLEEADDLVARARRGKALLQVGHVERFNPAVVALQDRVSDPRFIEAHRLSAFAFRSMDIDVVLDLMIHDIDIILHLVRSPLSEVAAAGVPVLFDSPDIANARLVFANGCVANVTASRASDKVMRKMRVFSRDLYASVDFRDRDLKIYRKAPGMERAAAEMAAAGPAALGNPMEALLKLIRIEDVPVPDHEPLVKELESFVDSVRAGRPPVVPGEHGRLAMDVAARIQAAMREHAARQRA